MLQRKTVTGELFELLVRLMKDERLKEFNLAGGTALALYMGHRKSVDLDLFTPKEFNPEELRIYLDDKYMFTQHSQSNATLIGEINGIKVDCIHYNYPIYKSVNEIEGIRMYSLSDIAAMKLSATMQSGERLKDFIDLAYLSTKMSLSDMLTAFEYKFPRTNILSAVKGLVYFNQIRFDVNIQMFDGKFNWKNIEKRLIDMTKNPDKIYLSPPLNDKEKKMNS